MFQQIETFDQAQKGWFNDFKTFKRMETFMFNELQSFTHATEASDEGHSNAQPTIEGERRAFDYSNFRPDSMKLNLGRANLGPHITEVNEGPLKRRPDITGVNGVFPVRPTTESS